MTPDSSGTVRRRSQPGPMVVRDRIELPTFRFSGLRITIQDGPWRSMCLLGELRCTPTDAGVPECMRLSQTAAVPTAARGTGSATRLGSYCLRVHGRRPIACGHSRLRIGGALGELFALDLLPRLGTCRCHRVNNFHLLRRTRFAPRGRKPPVTGARLARSIVQVPLSASASLNHDAWSPPEAGIRQSRSCGQK